MLPLTPADSLRPSLDFLTVRDSDTAAPEGGPALLRRSGFAVGGFSLTRVSPAINIRAIAKGDVGSRSEKLVELGVAPLRPRTRKRRPPRGPEEIEPAAPSV